MAVLRNCNTAEKFEIPQLFANLLAGKDLLNAAFVGLHPDEIDQEENQGDLIEKRGKYQHTDAATALIGGTKVPVKGVQILVKLSGNDPVYDTKSDEHTAKEQRIDEEKSKTEVIILRNAKQRQQREDRCKDDAANDKYSAADPPGSTLPAQEAVGLV